MISSSPVLKPRSSFVQISFPTNVRKGERIFSIWIEWSSPNNFSVNGGDWVQLFSEYSIQKITSVRHLWSFIQLRSKNIFIHLHPKNFLLFKLSWRLLRGNIVVRKCIIFGDTYVFNTYIFLLPIIHSPCESEDRSGLDLNVNNNSSQRQED